MPTITEINLALTTSGNQILNLTEVNLATCRSYVQESIYELLATPGVKAILLENNEFSALTQTQIEDFFLSLHKASNLTYLRFRGNNLAVRPVDETRETLVRGLLNVPGLRYLDLSNNQLGALEQSDLVNLFCAVTATKTQITHLDLSNNELTQEQLDLIRQTLGNPTLIINSDPETPIHRRYRELQIPEVAHWISAKVTAKRFKHYFLQKINAALVSANLADLRHNLNEIKSILPEFFQKEANCEALLTTIFTANPPFSLPTIESVTAMMTADIIYQVCKYDPLYSLFEQEAKRLPKTVLVELVYAAIQENNNIIFKLCWDLLTNTEKQAILTNMESNSLTRSPEFDNSLAQIMDEKIAAAVAAKDYAQLMQCREEFGLERTDAAISAKLSRNDETSLEFRGAFLEMVNCQDDPHNCRATHAISDGYRYVVNLIAQNDLLTAGVEATIQRGSQVWKQFLPEIRTYAVKKRMDDLDDSQIKRFIEKCKDLSILTHSALLERVIATNDPSVLWALLSHPETKTKFNFYSMSINHQGKLITLRDFLFAESTPPGYIIQIWKKTAATLLCLAIDLYPPAADQTRLRRLQTLVGAEKFMAEVVNYFDDFGGDTYGAALAAYVLMHLSRTVDNYRKFLSKLETFTFDAQSQAKMAVAYQHAFRSSGLLVPPGKAVRGQAPDTIDVNPKENGVTALHVINHWLFPNQADKARYFATLTPPQQINLLETACWRRRTTDLKKSKSLVIEIWCLLGAKAQKTILTAELYAPFRESSLFKDAMKTQIRHAITHQNFSPLVFITANNSGSYEAVLSEMKLDNDALIAHYLTLVNKVLSSELTAQGKAALQPFIKLGISNNLLDRPIPKTAACLRELLATNPIGVGIGEAFEQEALAGKFTASPSVASPSHC